MIAKTLDNLHFQNRRTLKSPTEVVFKNGRQYLKRKENWGAILYDFKRDLFLANAHNVADEIMPAAPLAVYWLIVAPCNLRC